MKAAAYHIRFEVYLSSQQLKDKLFLPAAGFDIFKDHLPAHKSSAVHRSTQKTDQPQASQSPSHTSPKQSHNDALLLPERNAALKDSPSCVKRLPDKPDKDAAARDWRYGPVSIDSIDMTLDRDAPKTGPVDPHTKAIYIPSNVKTTDIGSGVVHLYKDIPESDLLSQIQQRKALQDSQLDCAPLDIEHCTTLCILAVPSWMMPSDLLGFVGDQTRTEVSHLRLVRTDRANKYMVLIKFRQAKKAKEWQHAWNGRLFSAMEPENCHVVFVKSVDFISGGVGTGAGATDNKLNLGSGTFPQHTSIDPFMSPARSAYSGPLTASAKPVAPPTPALVELPTCPVCLERMDETTGLLTILCQHVFHCACLEKWRGSGCPVCRYTQSPSYTFPYPRPLEDKKGNADEDEPLCSVCASSANLWICLICGNTGCGRYDSAHAYAHYEITSHCYAMDISTQRVWDYAGDGYVHRLIQNKEEAGSGKSIRQPPSGPTVRQSSHPNNAFRAEGYDSVPREKMEAMANEYTYLLTNQLESQRRYYEEQLERAVDKASTAGQRAEHAAAQASSAGQVLREVQNNATSQQETIAQLEKSLEKISVRADKFERMSRDLMRQVKEETTMNQGLMTRITAAEATVTESREKAETLRAEKLELEEMNRDLTIFISSQDRIKELEAQGEEIEGADVAVPEQSTRFKGKGRRKK